MTARTETGNVVQYEQRLAASHAEIEQAFRALPAATQEAVERLARFGIHPAGQR